MVAYFNKDNEYILILICIVLREQICTHTLIRKNKYIYTLVFGSISIYLEEYFNVYL